MVLRDVNYLESNFGRDLGRDRLSRVLYRARSRGTRDCRACAQSPHLAALRLDGHGHRHLEHALRRHARLPDADRNPVRRAARAHVRADRDRRRVSRALHGEPPQLPARHLLVAGPCLGVAIAGMHYTGMAAMRMPATLHYDALRVCRLDRDRGLRVVRRALARLPLPQRRNDPRPLAPRVQRARHGCRHRRHALHGHERGRVRPWRAAHSPSSFEVPVGSWLTIGVIDGTRARADARALRCIRRPAEANGGRGV